LFDFTARFLYYSYRNVSPSRRGQVGHRARVVTFLRPASLVDCCRWWWCRCCRALSTALHTPYSQRHSSRSNCRPFQVLSIAWLQRSRSGWYCQGDSCMDLSGDGGSRRLQRVWQSMVGAGRPARKRREPREGLRLLLAEGTREGSRCRLHACDRTVCKAE